jgi:hypothetical protein
MNYRLTSAVAVVLFAATVFASAASAQMRITGSARGARTRVAARLVGRGAFFRGGGRNFFPGPVLLPPYFYGDYDYDYQDQPNTTEAPAPAPQLLVVQPNPPQAPAASPVQSVVLENQGGQWVRISNYTPPAATQNVALPSPSKLPPTLLVYRNGRTEEVERYMIKGDFIFTDANYWTTGSWTRKVPIAELDLPATRKMNEERGGKFNLPSSPNEVIIR